MDVEGVLHGDPLEASALEGIRWSWDATSHTARPQSGDASDGSEPASAVSEGLAGGEIEARQSKKKAARKKAKKGGVDGAGDGSGGVAATVWRRYAFSSQLQRMSVIAEVSGGGEGSSGGGGAASLTAGDAGPKVGRILAPVVGCFGGAGWDCRMPRWVGHGVARVFVGDARHLVCVFFSPLRT